MHGALPITFETLRVTQSMPGVVAVVLHRPQENNSLNGTMVTELLSLVRSLAERADVKVVVLEGNAQHFCMGMDFHAYASQDQTALSAEGVKEYYDLLHAFSTGPQVIISKVRGKVNAGGIGLVAASDMVVADETTQFSLSEILFGLLPACVLPFLIRRIGYQKALWLALSTRPIDGQRALEVGLVDELGSDVNELVRRNLLRLTRLQPDNIRELKTYMTELYTINDATRDLATQKITALMKKPSVQSNISNYVNEGKFPWEQ